MREQTKVQKLVVGLAYLSYLAAVVCLGLLIHFAREAGGLNDPIPASLLATVIFFICVGIVLHVMGKTRLPNLSLDKN